MPLRSRSIWMTWLLLTAVLGSALAYRLWGSDDRSLFLVGETTHGHYQIELACEACHTKSFGGGETLQAACVQCHGAELKAANDSHPKSKFTDPRNADRVAILDARRCITCHVEHRPGLSHAMGLTLPEDYCAYCHQQVADDRPSHAGMSFDTCASAGCHNFHDNLALYEDFLVKHGNDKASAGPGRVPSLSGSARIVRETASIPMQPLTIGEADAPAGSLKADLVDAWSHSGHAGAGVNCSDCHSDATRSDDWLEQPDTGICKSCHEPQYDGWQAGLHGMRTAQGLSPMQPEWARLPMRQEAEGKRLDCMSCHAPHDVDTRQAAVERCLGCHDDEHSRAFKASPHFFRLQDTGRGEADGVSCAGCHMPRVSKQPHGMEVVIAEHNQNANLRPNEKMIRTVCMNCHGLGFSIDALADPELIRNNFLGRPSRHIESIDMALAREASR